MICEVYNKMGQSVAYVFDDNWFHKTKIELWEFFLMIFLFLFVLFILSWWLIPISFVCKKYGSITFYCKKGE